MSRRISNEETASLCLELSMLLKAGVSVDEALAQLAKEGQSKDILENMVEQVDSGETLPTALRKSGAFPPYVYGLVEAGERSGRTVEALATLAQYYENRERLARRVRSALLYPAVMLALMLVVIGVLLVKVLPIFDDVYASLGGRLTGVAAGLLTLGRWLEGAMPVLFVLLAAAAVLVLLFSAAPPFRAALTSFWQKSRGDKGVSRKLNNARMAHALAMYMASGVPEEEAVDGAAQLMEGAARERCETCRKRLEEGESLPDALERAGMLSPRQSLLLKVGMRSGEGTAAIEKVAGELGEEGDASLDALVSRVEPALVLVCSVLVGLILLSVMLPLMHIMSAIG